MRKMLRAKRLSVVLGLLILGYLALVGVLSITRGTPVKAVVAIGKKEGPPAITDSLFSRMTQLCTGLNLSPGNAAELVDNGEVYRRLWKDLRAAKHTITVQMYYSQPGAVADTMAWCSRRWRRRGCVSSSCSTPSAP